MFIIDSVHYNYKGLIQLHCVRLTFKLFYIFLIKISTVSIDDTILT